MSGSVLIIDGDQAFAENAQNALEAAGLTVWVRQDGTFDTVRELRPHVLLLNVELPRGSGFAICSRIRRDKALKTTPIFLTSAEATAEAFQRHAETGDSANDYAQKPIAIDDVVNRVGRLIAQRPPPIEAQQTGDAGPPPIPPPLKRGPDEPPAIPPALTATQENTPIPTRGLGSDDLWPSSQYDDAIRAAGQAEAEAASKGRVSPEERLQAMRVLVKQHELQKRAFTDTWQRANERGQELARRIVGLTSELENRDARIQELEVVQGEFRTFQDEITRIFKEKDAEETQRAEYIQNLEATNTAQGVQLQEAFERQTDDERRLEIIQEDLELLQNEKDAAVEKLAEVEGVLELAREQITDVEKRLEMTNGVAAERAEEVTNLRDQIDQVAFEHTKERQRIDNAHEEKIESLLAEHVASMERLREEREEALAEAKREHEREVEAVDQRNADLLDALNGTHEAEIEDAQEQIALLERQHTNVLARADQLERQLQDALQSHASEVGALTADFESLRERARQLEDDLDRATSNEMKLEHARSALETKLAEATNALQTARTQIESQEHDLEGARETTRAQKEQLEANSDEIEATQRELDVTQAELFERISEVDHLKKQLSSLEARLADFDTSLRTTEKSLKSTEAELRVAKTRAAESDAERIALEQQVELLEEQHTRLEEKVRDTENMLEEERAALTQSEDGVRRARIDLQEETAARNELEGALQAVQTERQKLEVQVEELQTEASEMAEKVDRLERQRVDLNAALDEAETSLEQTEAARAELESEVQHIQTQLAVSEGAYEQAERAAQSTAVELEEAVAARQEAEREAEATRVQVAGLEHALNEAHADLADRAAEGEELERTSTGQQAQLERLQAESRAFAQSQTKRFEAEQSARSRSEEALAVEKVAKAEIEALLNEATAAQSTLASKVEALETELSTKEAQLADAYAGQTDAARQAASNAELSASLADKTREVENLQAALASVNEELEIHRAQAQGLSHNADRAEQTTSALTAELTTARRTLQTLENSEKALMARVSDQEDTLNEWRFATESMKGTLSALQRDIETASAMTDSSAVGRSYDQLLQRITRAVSMCMETLNESDDSVELPAVQVASVDLKVDELTDDDFDIPIYTGEVEALDPLGDLEQEGIRIVQRTPITPISTPESSLADTDGALPPVPTGASLDDSDEPFAALMAELSATDSGPVAPVPKPPGFGESFDGEATTNDVRALTSKSLPPQMNDEDEDERNVTEIINIHELE